MGIGILAVDDVDGELDGIQGVFAGFGDGSRKRVERTNANGFFFAFRRGHRCTGYQQDPGHGAEQLS
jgi:hypothetical protein